LEKEVKSISDKTERVVKNALIIGGTLALTYLLVTQLSSSRKRRKVKVKPSEEVDAADSSLEEAGASYSPPSFISQIGERLATQATALLLGIAKDKLGEYLSNRKQKDENS
jgi:hypothetical protein